MVSVGVLECDTPNLFEQNASQVSGGKFNFTPPFKVYHRLTLNTRQCTSLQMAGIHYNILNKTLDLILRVPTKVMNHMSNLYSSPRRIIIMTVMAFQHFLLPHNAVFTFLGEINYLTNKTLLYTIVLLWKMDSFQLPTYKVS